MYLTVHASVYVKGMKWHKGWREEIKMTVVITIRYFLPLSGIMWHGSGFVFVFVFAWIVRDYISQILWQPLKQVQNKSITDMLTKESLKPLIFFLVPLLAESLRSGQATDWQGAAAEEEPRKLIRSCLTFVSCRRTRQWRWQGLGALGSKQILKESGVKILGNRSQQTRTGQLLGSQRTTSWGKRAKKPAKMYKVKKQMTEGQRGSWWNLPGTRRIKWGLGLAR